MLFFYHFQVKKGIFFVLHKYKWENAEKLINFLWLFSGIKQPFYVIICLYMKYQPCSCKIIYFVNCEINLYAVRRISHCEAIFHARRVKGFISLKKR